MAETCRCAFVHNITQFVDSVAADHLLARVAGILVSDRTERFCTFATEFGRRSFDLFQRATLIMQISLLLWGWKHFLDRTQIRSSLWEQAHIHVQILYSLAPFKNFKNGFMESHHMTAGFWIEYKYLRLRGAGRSASTPSLPQVNCELEQHVLDCRREHFHTAAAAAWQTRLAPAYQHFKSLSLWSLEQTGPKKQQPGIQK